ncbi:MAG: SUMF1/EgtB/PvdO family nonheme iron enzyme [Planctomycetes bacterium]|nr:SUMF1/EgtB/PvdO family nonheme iron enzyme [Planctomycetota bacterium]
MSVSLSELGAIAEGLAAVAVSKELASLIELRLRRPQKADLEARFTRWCQAPPDGVKLSWEMGSPPEEDGRFRDEDQVPVGLSAPFWVMPTSVTYGMWCLMAPKADHAKGWGEDARLPVTHVSWFEASLYARWLDHWLRELLPALIPAGHRVALPTEAQREFFTRAGTTTRFWSGDADEDLERVGWFGGNSEGLPQPVGEKAGNAWGVHDVHGNVWEWCRDWFHEELRGGLDPLGPRRGRDRVLRGGSYWYDAGHCRSAFRYWDWPGDARDDGGFRLVLSAPER